MLSFLMSIGIWQLLDERDLEKGSITIHKTDKASYITE